MSTPENRKRNGIIPEFRDKVSVSQEPLLLPGEPTPLETFEAFKRRRPDVKSKLIQAAREIRRAHKVECDIHTAYGLATELYGLKCCRSWLPAFAREIEAETDLRFSTRTSRFDEGGILL